MSSKIYTTEWAGKKLVADFNSWAGQANGSVVLTYGETVILVTAVMSKKDNLGLNYFPLTVEFEERYYAAGAILGSRYQRREGRPSDEAILAARLIDRTIRPLFNQSLRREIQVAVTVLARGEEAPDILGVLGASLVLAVSDIPWAGPIGVVRFLRNTHGELFLNPTRTETRQAETDFEITACGQSNTINMIEANANEIQEADTLALLEAATVINSELEQWQKEITSNLGKKKIIFATPEISESVHQLYEDEFAETLYQTIFSNRTGKSHLNVLTDEFLERVQAIEPEANLGHCRDFFDQKLDETLHRGVVIDKKRADGRAFTEVRSLTATAGGVSPVLHGSGLFYRGETHVLTALTLGGPETAQLIDTMETQDGKKTFMHHYNFPPFSVGETGRFGGTNRRMIGHGALAEKALRPLIPDAATFPYTIRLVSETLSSNGSSSMGSVCASSLALFDGGVPLKKHVAGIASGVMIKGEEYVLLTDIQGPEDEYGDMDFKVAGTIDGITAIQMDVKVDGIKLEILAGALADAKTAREQIIKTLTAAIATPREKISARAPQILTLSIKPEQIGLVIGGGGKTINKIKGESGATEITIEEDGQVFITGLGDSAAKARDLIAAMTKEYLVGDKLSVTVTKLTDFGAFVRLDDYHEGLIHISEITNRRLDSASEVLAAGQVVPAVVIKIEGEKIGLSLKQADPDFIK